jgi:predicted AAA+ superfamily ATPase
LVKKEKKHMIIKRLLKMELPQSQSAFLWGARKTGKSTYLKETFPHSIYFDLLNTSLQAQFLEKPWSWREQLLKEPTDKLNHHVIIDEIQKVPLLLDEVHWLIENKKIGFILCGSSAIKLKRGAANLLGGRAWRFNFYPLVYKEISNFDLLRALNHGLLPAHYLSNDPNRMLESYIGDYLIQEIQAEGIVRNLPSFARFMDLVGFTNGQMLNYSNIARDSAVSAKTIKEYYQILVDTLMGYYIFPYHKKNKRDLVRFTPKFYLFDVGLANFLAKIGIKAVQGEVAGRAFEHFIFMELAAFYRMPRVLQHIYYWRSKSGLEVDFILNDGDMAVEVKVSTSPRLSDIKGLIAYVQDYQPKHAIVVSQDKYGRLLTTINKTKILVLPWQEFLDELWAGKYM